MTYDQQILDILTAVGEKGISVQLLAKHVYNSNLSFFFTPNLEEIRAYIQQYLLEKMERRGYYRLNTQNNPDARQLLIDFREESLPSDKEERPDTNVDLSLDLFG